MPRRLAPRGCPRRSPSIRRGPMADSRRDDRTDRRSRQAESRRDRGSRWRAGPMGEAGEDLGRGGEGGDGISVIRGSDDCRGWNGIRYKLGMSSKNVGASRLSMKVATIPPGGVAAAHVHVGFEVMLSILRGRVRHDYGPGLAKAVENQAGDFLYIEPGVPHEVVNLSDTEPVVAVVARSDADEWEHIVP